MLRPTPSVLAASWIRPQDFAATLKESLASLLPVRPRTPKNAAVFTSQELNICSHVFLRVDSVRRPHQQPYHGPFKVLRRTRKTFTQWRHPVCRGRQSETCLPAPGRLLASEHRCHTCHRLVYLNAPYCAQKKSFVSPPSKLVVCILA